MSVGALPLEQSLHPNYTASNSSNLHTNLNNVASLDYDFSQDRRKTASVCSQFHLDRKKSHELGSNYPQDLNNTTSSSSNFHHDQKKTNLFCHGLILDQKKVPSHGNNCNENILGSTKPTTNSISYGADSPVTGSTGSRFWSSSGSSSGSSNWSSPPACFCSPTSIDHSPSNKRSTIAADSYCSSSGVDHSELNTCTIGSDSYSCVRNDKLSTPVSVNVTNKCDVSYQTNLSISSSNSSSTRSNLSLSRSHSGGSGSHFDDKNSESSDGNSRSNASDKGIQQLADVLNQLAKDLLADQSFLTEEDESFPTYDQDETFLHDDLDQKPFIDNEPVFQEVKHDLPLKVEIKTELPTPLAYYQHGDKLSSDTEFLPPALQFNQRFQQEDVYFKPESIPFNPVVRINDLPQKDIKCEDFNQSGCISDSSVRCPCGSGMLDFILVMNNFDIVHDIFIYI